MAFGTWLLLSSLQVSSALSGEIVVTGRGLGEGAGDEVYDIVTIDRERLTGSASNRLEDVLRDVPGFQNFRRSDARSANPTSQGATLRALGGNASSRALLILDGVPQTDPFGGWVYWPAYDPRRLGAVRVMRGGGSGVNGPGALAGTIELISAGPADLEGMDAEISYGSRDSIDALGSAAARLGTGHASLTGAYARGDGFIPVIASQRGAVDRDSPYEQASVALRAATPLSATTELQVGGLWFKDRRERGTAFTLNRTTGADASLRIVNNGTWRWSALAYVQSREYYNSFASVAAGRASVAQASEQYDVPSSGTGARVEIRPPIGHGIELRIGADWRRTEGETRERSNFVAGSATRGRIAGGESSTLGGFIEAAWEEGTLTLTAGARADRWRISKGFRIEQNLLAGTAVPTLFPDRTGWEPTARGGAAWRAAEALTLRAAAYVGWRLPTLNELYRPFRVGPDATAANAALKPERLTGFEAGLDYRPLSTLRFGLTVFDNRLEDAIANVTLGQGPGNFEGVGFVGAGGTYSQRRNLDSVRARGIEADASATFGDWRLSGGLSRVDAKVRASGAALRLDGRRPAQTPRTMATATLAWRNRAGAAASFTGRYVGNQYEDDLGADRLPDALAFDATASLPVVRGLTIEARAENLTDARIVAGISGAGIVERATPRTLWIGLTLDH